MTIGEVLSAYLKHSAAVGLHCREALIERQRIFARFSSAFGQLDVLAAKPFHLSDWIESHAGWRSISTKRAKANAIRAAFQWAEDQERIDRNPFRKVRYAEAERRPDLPDVFFERIARKCNKRFEAAIRFLRLTGCRLGELCKAKWDDFDLAAGVWVIHRHKSRRFTGKPKIVALVAQAVELLKSIERESDIVFLNTRNSPWNRRTLGQEFRRSKDRFGIKTNASLHGIRHRAASLAIANGAPIKLVAQQLGHSSVVVTERYYCNLTGAIEGMREAISKGIPKSD